MEDVKFYGPSFAEKTEAGRTVHVSMADDGSLWGFQIGNPDDPADGVRFALSAEAFEILESLVKRLRAMPRGQHMWRFVVTELTSNEKFPS